MGTTRKLSTETNNAAKGVVNRAIDDVSDLSATARRALGETAQKAGEVVSDIAEEAATQGKRVAKAAVGEMREHPIRTLAIGASVGVLIAAVLTRKR